MTLIYPKNISVCRKLLGQPIAPGINALNETREIDEWIRLIKEINGWLKKYILNSLKEVSYNERLALNRIKCNVEFWKLRGVP